jgi:hypothetical protein
MSLSNGCLEQEHERCTMSYCKCYCHAVDFQQKQRLADDGPEVDILRAVKHGYITETDALGILSGIKICRRDNRG